MTDDLITWLRAQLDEDERVAREAGTGRWVDRGGNVVSAGLADGDFGHLGYWVASASFACEGEAEGMDESHTAHIARHDPARVLAEVVAKRRIVNSFAASSVPLTTRTAEFAVVRMVLKLFALPYADRPGYRAEWAPPNG